ncbi:MAG: hypothetical protein F9K28_11545, partial [Bacteroidetes bacterium]
MEQPSQQNVPTAGTSGVAPFPFVCPYCVDIQGYIKRSGFLSHLKKKHAHDSATRVIHHTFPCCQTVSCCRFCDIPLPTPEGRIQHEIKRHPNNFTDRNAPTSPPSSPDQEDADDDSEPPLPPALEDHSHAQEQLTHGDDPTSTAEQLTHVEDPPPAQDQAQGVPATIANSAGTQNTPLLNEQAQEDPEELDNHDIALQDLFKAFNCPLYQLHHRWTKPMKEVTTALIKLISVNGVFQEKGTYAFFMLPGLLKFLTVMRAPRPVDFLRQCQTLATNGSRLVAHILATATKMLPKLSSLEHNSNLRGRSRNNSHHCRSSEHIILARGRRTISKLFRDGRYSTATRVVEQAHMELNRGPNASVPHNLSSQEVVDLIGQLNPPATNIGTQLPVDPSQPAEPFQFTVDFIHEAIRQLP